MYTVSLLSFRDVAKVGQHSKAGKPLSQYYLELLTALRKLPHSRFVVDSEIVIYSGEQLAFDDLLMRIHPAESRIRKLSNESPATLMCFDLLVDHNGKLLTELSLAERRAKLQEFFHDLPVKNLPAEGVLRLSPASHDRDQA